MKQHLTTIHTERATGRSWYGCTCGHVSGFVYGGTVVMRTMASVHRGSRRKQVTT